MTFRSCRFRSTSDFPGFKHVKLQEAVPLGSTSPVSGSQAVWVVTFCICRQAWNPRPGNTCPTGHKPQTLFEVAAADLWAGSDCTSCRRHQFPAKSAPTPPKMKSHQPAEQQFARACFRIRGLSLNRNVKLQSHMTTETTGRDAAEYNEVHPQKPAECHEIPPGNMEEGVRRCQELIVFPPQTPHSEGYLSSVRISNPFE